VNRGGFDELMTTVENERNTLRQNTLFKRRYEKDDASSYTLPIDDDREFKRLKATPSVPEVSAEIPSRFACPYRKHDSRKYCLPHWRSCTLTPLQTVARVK
jgi:hypothetical protein